MTPAQTLASLALLPLLLSGCGPTSEETPSAPAETTGPTEYLSFGAGNVATSYNPAGFRCKQDHGSWILHAGVTLRTEKCTSDGQPTAPRQSRPPQVTGPAASEKVVAHRWWGSLTFFGESTVSNEPNPKDSAVTSDVHDAAYITPDPVFARLTNRGVRIMNLPAGLQTTDENNFLYANPSLTAEVFDGVAIGNSIHSEMDAYLKSSSDASATVEWQAQGQAVMEATFVQGSPYVFFKTLQGNLVLKTLKEDGEQKGVFLQQENKLGVWTEVKTNRQHFLLVGEGETEFNNIAGSEIEVSSASSELTLVLLPEQANASPTAETIDSFSRLARNRVSDVIVDYQVAPANNEVTVTHTYLDQKGSPIETLAGLQPLHWKNIQLSTERSSSFFTPYKVRSARGVTKFASTHSFSYTLPFIGVLPAMPSELGDYDMAKLKGFVKEFMAEDQSQWNTFVDTYWSGKNYGKVAELAAIARSIGMTKDADTLVDWLKSEMEDWFSANTSGSLDVSKYFVYDKEWHTLLGVNESFGSHRMLNDHHFHYGYFVRAAAEICRVDISWCSQDQFGPMVDLLIRDFAAGRNDELFPYLRHFDPANGFSWASGSMPYFRGNNNESTSEAANAYGAMVLYGLITQQPDLVARGTYLHASTTATYWQYWNDIDGYHGGLEEERNFPSDYKRITTSIIWGDGALFDTWFSRRYAHILGIQGLPANPLIVHVAQYKEYMADYVKLGLEESKNGKPSGLKHGHWKDIWWNLWAMNDADAAIADYNTVTDYIPEEGETKAHTYHWLHTWKNLGQLVSGTGAITADHPATMVFEKENQRIYVAYNFSKSPKEISFSDGTRLMAKPNGFATLVQKKN